MLQRFHKHHCTHNAIAGTDQTSLANARWKQGLLQPKPATRPHTHQRCARSRRPTVGRPRALLGLLQAGRAGRGKGSSESIEDKVLSTFLSGSATPYSSYIADPRSFLHDVHPIIKQVWLVVVLGTAGRAPAAVQASLCLVTVLQTISTLPPRLWQPQLKRLGLLCTVILLFVCIGADSVPPKLQTRAPPPQVSGLPSLAASKGAYKHVLFHWGIFTITQRSLTLACSSASLTFLALQSASLTLTTTPSEEIALALQSLMSPLRFLGVPVKQVTLSVLLALRFMALVLEEMRNLALGLAMRGVDWKAMGPGSGLNVIVRLVGRLFSNLFRQSEAVAQALHARGFVSADEHTIYTGLLHKSRPFNNVICCSAIAGLLAQAFVHL
ncbi:hypothetical protein WJX73_000023 [Symbiochloris irregularis]|uniref:Cobalt transport protein n=1 Tax=Symbiochloris irregularis TaxID=706552 RepID=A0AAW1P2M0_9CHLO